MRTDALEKDPGRRAQTAREVRAELEQLCRTILSGVPAAEPTPAPAATTATTTPSIAVLPFANRSREEDDEYFVDGLADELINVLAKIRGLRVAAHTSSFRFKGSKDDLATIGGQLNVVTLLEGSVRKAGNRLRVSVQLVKVEDGFHLWSETYDRTLEDIFAVQDDIAQSVVKELRRTLLGEEPDSKASAEVVAEVADAARGRGASGEAHRLFLQGRFLVGRHTREDNIQAIGYLQQAVEVDPGHALVHYMAGLLAYNLGRNDEAVRLSRLGVEKDPLSAVAYSHLARAYRGAGQLEDAEAAFRQALELSPQAISWRLLLALVLVELGRLDEALATAEREVAAYGRECSLAIVHHAAGRPEESDRALERLIELGTGDSAYQVAMVYAARTEADSAFEWLERAYEQRDSGLSLLKPERIFRPLHADPRWEPFLQKMGLAD